MEYIIYIASFFALVIDPDGLRLAFVLNGGKEYMDLTVILTTALFAIVGVDQISLLMGEFRQPNKAPDSAVSQLSEKPFLQFFKYQLFSGIKKENPFLEGAEEMGHLKFFLYNLLAVTALLTLLMFVGVIIRMAWVSLFGHFGPFEFELLSALMVAYLLFFAVQFSKKR